MSQDTSFTKQEATPTNTSGDQQKATPTVVTPTSVVNEDGSSEDVKSGGVRGGDVTDGVAEDSLDKTEATTHDKVTRKLSRASLRDHQRIIVCKVYVYYTTSD